MREAIQDIKLSRQKEKLIKGYRVYWQYILYQISFLLKTDIFLNFIFLFLTRHSRGDLLN